jgi:hypothetical protein
METLMKTSRKWLLQGALAALLGAGAVVASTGSASAYIVCNRDGDCWHTHSRHHYRSAWGITVHPDHWRWRGDHYRWREHAGRGYWRSGVWITF